MLLILHLIDMLRLLGRVGNDEGFLWFWWVEVQRSEQNGDLIAVQTQLNPLNVKRSRRQSSEDRTEIPPFVRTYLMNPAVQCSLFHHGDDDGGVNHVLPDQSLHSGAPAAAHCDDLPGARGPLLPRHHFLEVLQDHGHLHKRQKHCSKQNWGSHFILQKMCTPLLSCHLLRCLWIKNISLVQHQVTYSQEQEALSIQQSHHGKRCRHQQLTWNSITKAETIPSKILFLIQTPHTDYLSCYRHTHSSSGSWTSWAHPGPYPAAHWWDGDFELLYCPPWAPAPFELSPSQDTESRLQAADKHRKWRCSSETRIRSRQEDQRKREFRTVCSEMEISCLFLAIWF